MTRPNTQTATADMKRAMGNGHWTQTLMDTLKGDPAEHPKSDAEPAWGHRELSMLPRRGVGHYAVDHLPLPLPSARIGYLRLAAKGAANTMNSAETSTETSAATSAEASGEKIRGVVDQTLEEAEPLVDKVLERTESFVEKAKKKAELLAEKVLEKAEPLAEKVKEKAEPLVEKAEGSSGKDSTS